MTTTNRSKTTAALVLGLALCCANVAAAATLRVAAQGLDGPACGGKKTPCRSIGRAITLAAPGDSIEVGPGRYGLLNGTEFGPRDGDESGGGEVMIRITKPLRVISRDGAGATILHVDRHFDVGVLIESSDVVFGGRKRGFTITGAYIALQMQQGADDGRIEGNWARGNDFGFQTDGARTRVLNNRALANTETGFTIRGTAALVQSNVASANKLGFFVANSRGGLGDHVVRDNVASANGPNLSTAGVALRAPVRFERNLVTGNDGIGVGVYGGSEGARIAGNRIAGNVGVGLEMSVAGAVITGNDIYANGARNIAGVPNCGLWNGTGTAVDAPGNYWGDPDGPGADPADDACFNPTTVEPVAKKAHRIRSRAAR